jgi:sensor histidine kinase YesM
MFAWLVLGLFVVSIGVWVLGYKLTWHYHHKGQEYYGCWSEEASDLRYYYNNKEEKWELVRVIGKIAFFIIGVVLIICLLILTVNYACSTYNEMKLTTEYESLCYKASMIETRDEFGLLNKEYIDEIHEWNMKVKEGKYWQNHFWFGVFNPDIYDSVDVIDLWSVEMGH